MSNEERRPMVEKMPIVHLLNDLYNVKKELEQVPSAGARLTVVLGAQKAALWWIMANPNNPEAIKRIIEAVLAIGK